MYATTRHFLDDLGLRSLEELPTLDANWSDTANALLPGLAQESSMADREAVPSESESVKTDDAGVMPDDEPQAAS